MAPSKKGQHVMRSCEDTDGILHLVLDLLDQMLMYFILGPFKTATVHSPSLLLNLRGAALMLLLMASCCMQEPLGTHGGLKAIFDGVVQQRDTVCLSLFKRTFPRWPKDLNFA